jgi:hypothetical protein
MEDSKTHVGVDAVGVMEWAFLAVCHAGDTARVRSILRRSESASLVDIANPFNGRTALHTACAAGDVDVVRVLLLEFAANCWTLSAIGATPMDALYRRARMLHKKSLQSVKYEDSSSCDACCDRSPIHHSRSVQNVVSIYKMLSGKEGHIAPLEKPQSLVGARIRLEGGGAEQHMLASVLEYDDAKDVYIVRLASGGAVRKLKLYSSASNLRKMVLRFTIVRARLTEHSTSLSDYVFSPALPHGRWISFSLLSSAAAILFYMRYKNWRAL